MRGSNRARWIQRPTGVAFGPPRPLVMAGLVPAIHALRHPPQDVDARHKAGHDECWIAAFKHTSILRRPGERRDPSPQDCVVAAGRGPTSPNDVFLWLWVLACARTTEERDRLTSARGLAAHGVRVFPLITPSFSKRAQ